MPALFRVETMSALARRGEHDELLELVDTLVRGPRFYCHPIDPDLLARATDVARTARLRAYDAVYVALALAQKAPLFTLDSELLAKAADHFPALDVRASA